MGWLQGAWTSVRDEIFVFRPAKTLVVKDPPLGLLQKLLVLTISIVLLGDFFRSRRYISVGEVAGSVTEFNFERLDFNARRNRSFEAFPYCNNRSYDYFFPTKERTKPPHSYWNDNNIACKQAMFADLLDTDGENRIATLMTYEKVSRGVTRACSESSKCERQSPKGTILRGGGGDDGEAFVLREAGSGTFSCTCLEYRNFFPVRPEGIGLRLHHNYSTTHNLDGGSLSKKPDLAPLTVVKRKPNFDGVNYAHEKRINDNPSSLGHSIRLSVDEILRYAFAVEPGSDRSPLDERIIGDSVELLQGHERPFRRLTGVTINLDFDCTIKLNMRHTATTERPKCELQISYTDGIVSWLPPVQVVKQASLDTERTQEREYTEIYRRGILFRLSSTGRVESVSWVRPFMEVFVQLTVFLPLVTTVVSMISRQKGLWNGAHVYQPAIQQPLSYPHEMRRFAARSALVAAAFAEWDRDGSGSIEVDEMTRVFSKAGLKPEQAKTLAFTVFEDGSEQGQQFITVKSLIDIMGDELSNFEQLERYSRDSLAHALAGRKQSKFTGIHRRRRTVRGKRKQWLRQFAASSRSLRKGKSHAKMKVGGSEKNANSTSDPNRRSGGLGLGFWRATPSAATAAAASAPVVLAMAV